ncbi:MAG: 2Fe-2S iron-sulfur cluster binding domain-containing protein [Candidatus Peribacteria bacterium]|jgi:ferredoxin|nr:2Fe-2S iron-sulfur cluster binding domain-containing protein [Candidatus Peribacteria bacterium]
MSITVSIKDPSGKELGSFVAQDEKSFQELAAMHGISIPLACGGGVCGVCLCQVQNGGEAIQPDKITTPLIPLPRDEQGNPKEILACVAGVKSEMFADGEEHTITLQKAY